ncbi:hybrid sensor histidine kinase/response regulator [Photobacterium alginatilyticum]|uniref:histidine kinase n=1 Tax=Photobacterium alginatilyticum TaxID=1775171 RepID=A0ABW9YSM8_9GAMM|nr:ATP-binding protein [Photobacterium alginatilyticum]NBI55911.1 response regulator [Photobacterium alginatilyticum]
MPQNLNKVRKLKIYIITLICILGFIVISLIPFLVNNLQERNALDKHLLAVKQATQDIIYFDEVLTMSARMYAFTQSPAWEKRYLHTANSLDNALEVAQSLEPTVKDAIQATTKTNNQLIAIEMNAIELVKNQRFTDAQSLLLNDQYFELKAEYEEYVHRALQDAIHHNEVVILQKITKTKNWLLSSAFLLSILFFSLVLYFYSYNKKTEALIRSKIDELNNKVQELEALAFELDSANNAKSELLAKISHELKTPINGIHGSLQLIKYKKVNEEALLLVNNAISCSDMLVRLVDDILDFSKLKSSKYTLNADEYDLCALFASVQQIYTQECNAKGIKFHLSQKISCPNRFCDGLRLKQIIFNLLNNAVKFTHSGTVSLTVKEQATPEVIFVEVTDTGIGMNHSTQAKLFNDFEQGDSSITRVYGGTGLGMSIVKALVELMGGKIHVSSEPNMGTKVSLQLNLAISREEITKPDTTCKPDYLDSLKKLDVLVVEDNKVNQFIISKLLKSVGIFPVITNNGQEALESVSNDTQLVLMDIQMPVMDGVTACQYIKQSRPELPIIAVTANAQENDIKYYLNKGFEGVIPKPIKMDDLYLAIHKAVAASDIKVLSSPKKA